MSELDGEKAFVQASIILYVEHKTELRELCIIFVLVYGDNFRLAFCLVYSED